MQSNISVKVAPLLKEKKYNIDTNKFVDFMSKYCVNDWVYPNVIHRELKVDMKYVYEILELCADNEIMEQYLQIYCPICQRFTGSRYKTILEIPEFVNCVHCDEEIENPLKYAIIIYKVI